MNNNLNKEVVSATKWSTLSEILAKLISPIVNMILARILAPAAFGIIATITMVISFADIFTDAGFQKYLVQHEFANDKDLNDSTNVAFWTNFFISGLIYIVIFIFRNNIAKMLGNERLGDAISIANLTILMTTFSSIQTARYRRKFDFKTLFFVRAFSFQVPFLVTIPLALVFKNYWSLLIGSLVTNFLNAVILTIKSEWKPRFYFNFDKLKDMFAFSAWSLLESVSIWVTSYVGTFIVGNYFTDYYLGLYKTSITTVNSYMTIITGSTTTVLFSALSRLKEDEKGFQTTFFKFQRYVSMFVMPMGVGLFTFRKLATKILLGSQWGEAADFIGLWALMSAITIVFGHYNSEVFRSKGKPKLSLLSQVLYLIVLIPVLLLGSQYGFKALYLSHSLIRFYAILIGQVILWYNFRFSFIKIFKNVAPTIYASLNMGLVAIGLQQFSSSIIWQIISVAICMVDYFWLILLNPSMREELFEIKIVQKLLRRFHINIVKGNK